LPDTFVLIATQAHQKLNEASSAQFQNKLRPGAIGLFAGQVNTPQKEVADFCARLIHVAGFLQSAEIAPKLESDAALRSAVV
jgi:hypothetical protein